MKVIDGNFGNKGDDPDKSASDSLQAFADLADQIEEDTGLSCEAVVILLSPHGLTIGGNVLDPDGVNMLIDMGKWALLARQFGEDYETGGPDGSGTVH